MKRTTRKNNSQEEGLLKFLGPLMRVGLPLMKNVLSLLSLESLLDYKNSFFLKEYEKNDKIILQYLK